MMTMKRIAVLCLALLASLAASVKIELENLPERCDFRKCTPPDPKRLNVHLVPHSHDDVGWLKTVDQYFYGARFDIQKAGIQYTIDSVIEELIRNKDRRFIQVETAYFWMWWKEQGEEQREIVRELVKTGQLEFIGGGWSMNDEATTTYLATIDQMTWGHRRLVDTFGRCAVPKVAWQLDPFGHSKETAALFAGMGFDALFFARQDYQDIEQRVKTNTLEHMWQASEDLGTRGDLLTGMQKNHYGPLPGLRWDLIDDNDDPIVDNADSVENNLVAFLKTFEERASNYSVGYPTRNILVPMGEDFQYMAAHPFYKNMDKLIGWMSHSTKFKVFYSTPSCYAKALADSTDVTFSSKTDDFFPYASDPHSFWTGYFTSRAALKLQDRVGTSILQTGKIVEALSKFNATFNQKLIALKEEMGIMQHHDAVTGTEKQAVSDNYSKRLSKAVSGVQEGIGHSLKVLYNGTTVGGTFCPQLNVSSCPITETTSNFTVTLINPLATELINQTIRFPVKSGVGYTVVDLVSPSKNIPFTLIEIPAPVQKLAERKTSAKVDLLLQIPSIPPLSLVNLGVQEGGKLDSASIQSKKTSAANAVLKGHNLSVHFDGKGELAKVTLADGTVVNLQNQFYFYKGMVDKARNSAAYIFRPAEQKPTLAGTVTEATLHQHPGSTSPYLAEVHQTFSVDWISQVVRLAASPEGDDILEFEWTVGPIPVGDGVGKEVVTRYITDLKSGNRFKTDANGRQLLTRQLNFRPSWPLNVTEPVAGNYYPLNSRLILEDSAKKLAMTILVDRAQGATSLESGVAEVMLHRRLLHLDGKGVGEPLNETGVDGRGLVVRGRHQVVLSPLSKVARETRPQALRNLLPPVVSFSVASEAQRKVIASAGAISSLKTPASFPKNVHLLTLEQWRKEDELLLRLEHFYAKGEDAVLSKPATVSLRNLFVEFEILEAAEMTLSAHSPVEQLKQRLKFDYKPIGAVVTPTSPAVDPTKLEVSLHPMEIRTFVVKIKRH